MTQLPDKLKLLQAIDDFSGICEAAGHDRERFETLNEQLGLVEARFPTTFLGADSARIDFTYPSYDQMDDRRIGGAVLSLDLRRDGSPFVHELDLQGDVGYDNMYLVCAPLEMEPYAVLLEKYSDNNARRHPVTEDDARCFISVMVQTGATIREANNRL